jgi:integrase
VITDPDADLIFSPASLWEIAIKLTLDRGDFHVDPRVLRRVAHLTAVGLDALRDWMAQADIDQGPLFRPVYRGVALSRYLEPLTVSRMLKKLANKAGMEGEPFEKYPGIRSASVQHSNLRSMVSNCCRSCVLADGDR